MSRTQPSNASGNYFEGRPSGADDMQDSVFVITLLKDDASLLVTSGNNTQTFDAKAGANAFTIPMGLGKQTFSVSRNSAAIGGLSGDSLKDITDVCSCGIYNFNAYVGTLPAGESDSLGPDGLGSLTAGLHVSTCSATLSLDSTAAATAKYICSFYQAV
jgi:hypothetical protein